MLQITIHKNVVPPSIGFDAPFKCFGAWFASIRLWSITIVFTW